MAFAYPLTYISIYTHVVLEIDDQIMILYNCAYLEIMM